MRHIRFGGWGLRAAGSAALLAGLFWVLPRDAILTGFARIPVELFVAVFLLFLAGHGAAALKWWVLLDRTIPLPTAFRAHFAGLAANLCLPGVAGGDTVRAALAYGYTRDIGPVAAGSAADRLLDLLALACIALTALIVVGAPARDTNAWVALAALVVLLVLIGGCLYVIQEGAHRVWARFPSLPGQEPALRIAGALQALSARRGLLAVAVCASAAIQIGFILLAYALGRAVGLEVSLTTWAFAWALAKLVAVLPISLGGLGVREASLAALLVPFGADGAQVVAAGLAWQAVLFATGGLGALMLMVLGPQKTRLTVADEPGGE